MIGRLSGLYVITDSELCPGRTHAEIARAAVEGGAALVQIRDKHASDREFLEAALEIRQITEEAGVLFFVNDRLDVAAASGADGVNIGQSDLPVEVARGLLGDEVIIGVSVDSVDQAKKAQEDGADYVGFGPIFNTTTKPDSGPVSGLDALRKVCHEVSIPVVAIGGISIANIGSVAANGAACAAVVSAVVCAEDMVKATSDLVREFRKFIGW
ncbi:MAG: thiamine phosphate synthase [Armatimonadota bacterium]|nr:thiamine phosphate synthase [bacterium]